MEIVHERCAGLDVHKKTVVACVRHIDPDGLAASEVRTFGTMTADLLALADWLDAHGVGHVAMESTGVYWKPIFHVLEGRFGVMLVNAGRLKQVPGRKTDVKDAEWIAQLLQHGLLSPSFIPKPEIRELRDLTRQRHRVGPRPRRGGQPRPEGAGGRQRQAGLGRQRRAGGLGPRHDPGDDRRPGGSGEAGRVGQAEAAGQDPRAAAGAGAGSPAIIASSCGLMMDQIDALERLIRRLDERIDEAMRPFNEAAGRLQQIPGVGDRAAEVIMGEIGPDVEAFATPGRLCSWAGLCPGNDQSAGKRRSGKTTKGSPWLRSLLVQAAWSASHTKDTVFSACYRRWAPRLGRKKALIAVAHKILVVIWHMLKKGTDYQERRLPRPPHEPPPEDFQKNPNAASAAGSRPLAGERRMRADSPRSKPIRNGHSTSLPDANYVILRSDLDATNKANPAQATGD